MDIYEDNFDRPEVCKEWDPENPLCQVLGKYKLRLDSQPGQLPRYNYLEPYPGFSNECPSLSPDYIAPMGCWNLLQKRCQWIKWEYSYIHIKGSIDNCN